MNILEEQLEQKANQLGEVAIAKAYYEAKREVLLMEAIITLHYRPKFEAAKGNLVQLTHIFGQMPDCPQKVSFYEDYMESLVEEKLKEIETLID